MPALATELDVDATRMFAALDAAMREHLCELAGILAPFSPGTP